MKRFWKILATGIFLALLPAIASAQQVNNYWQTGTGSSGWHAVTTAEPFPVQVVGGGGGGLSVTDNSAWTNNSSSFTPNGGVFNDSATALSSGNQGTVRLNANREMHITCDIGNVLCGLINGPTPAGTNVIGKVGIDQTTPGTTNLVAIGPVGSGVQATAPRTTLATDSPGIIALGQTTKSASVPVTIASDQQAGTFPNAATAIQGNATGSTGAVVGTLAAAAAKTTYLCDFDVTALGTASSVGPIVIAGLLGGSKTYQMGTLATGTQQFLTKNFNPCLPGSATNTAITITTTADATATAVDVNSSGYQQ